MNFLLSYQVRQASTHRFVYDSYDSELSALKQKNLRWEVSLIP
jgi:hypothetical protein